MTAQFVHLLEQLKRRTLRMASLVEDILMESCEAVFSLDDKLAVRTIHRDNDVDSEEVEIEVQTIRLMALYQPVGCDLRLLCTILKVNNDLERIADCAVNISERARHLDPLVLQGHRDDLVAMASMVQDMLHRAVEAYGAQAEQQARDVQSSDAAVDAFYAQIIRAIVDDAPGHPDHMAGHLDVLSIAKNLERIADHATNIAEDVVFLATGRIVRHDTI